jgi:T4-like virus tail tube protein gp19
MADISAFKAQMIQGGARANQFRVEITFPAIIPNGALAGQKLQFLAKSSQLPASAVSDVSVMYRGRPVHFAGEREFAPWSIEVYNDNDFLVRNAFEAWIDTIQNSENTNGLQSPALYQVDMAVIQTDRNDLEVKRYTFKDAWPTEVGAISLDWESNNQIETFPVTFQYNFWTSPTSQGALG